MTASLFGEVGPGGLLDARSAGLIVTIQKLNHLRCFRGRSVLGLDGTEYVSKHRYMADNFMARWAKRVF